MRRPNRKKYNGGGYHASYRRSSRDYDDTYAKFRKIIRKRDKICQLCKATRCLQVHHIIPWAKAPYLRYEETNGILLCKKCHESIKNNEHFYIRLFTQIVNEKYKDKS